MHERRHRAESVKKYIRHVKGILSARFWPVATTSRTRACTRTYAYDVGFKRYIENITVLSHDERSRANFTSLDRKSSSIAGSND